MSHVYFISGESLDRIKIGFSGDPQRRLEYLQAGSPQRLQILATISGGCALERLLHQSFAEDRLDGEWFAVSPRLLELINEARSCALPPILMQKTTNFSCYSHEKHKKITRQAKLLYTIERVWRYLTKKTVPLSRRDIYWAVGSTTDEVTPVLAALTTLGVIEEIKNDFDKREVTKYKLLRPWDGMDTSSY